MFRRVFQLVDWITEQRLENDRHRGEGDREHRPSCTSHELPGIATRRSTSCLYCRVTDENAAIFQGTFSLPPCPNFHFIIVLSPFFPLWQSSGSGVVTAYADGNALRELSQSLNYHTWLRSDVEAWVARKIVEPTTSSITRFCRVRVIRVCTDTKRLSCSCGFFLYPWSSYIRLRKLLEETANQRRERKWARTDEFARPRRGGKFYSEL